MLSTAMNYSIHALCGLWINICSGRKPFSGENWVRGVEIWDLVDFYQLPPVGLGLTPFWWKITSGSARGSKRFFLKFPFFQGTEIFDWFCLSYGACVKVINNSVTWNVAQSEAIKLRKKIFDFQNFLFTFYCCTWKSHFW